jgi:hypothetical protein
MKNALKWFFVLVAAILIFSCGGGGGSNSSAPTSSPTLTIGGRVNGLSGAGLELMLNGGGRLSIEANGVFIFPESISNGRTYAVTVSVQPSNPTQHCITSNASGTSSDDVTDIEITCFEMHPGGPKYLVAPVNSFASSTYEDWIPSAVFDYDTSDSLWNSGYSAPQWIILDLGSPRAVTDIHLSVVQDPNGITSHQIYGGLTLDTLKLLVDLTGVTYNGQGLVVTIPASAPPLMQYLKIQTSTSPSWVAWGKIEVWANATNIPEYFGYYADAFTWLTSVTAEILEHANISWVSSDLANVSSFLANLQYAQDHGLKVALATPQDIFFDENLTLTTHYQDNWNYFASSVTPYLDSIAFIYPIDEPYSVAKVKSISAAEMKSRLETVSSLIKSTFPSKPVAFTFSAIDFDIQNSAFSDLEDPIPANYDWFGFDCYGSWEDCGEKTFNVSHSIPWYINQIKSKLDENQKVFLFSDAFVKEADPADPDADAAEALLRLGRADKYYQLALSESSIVGMFPFLYQDDYTENSELFLGVRHWPILQSKYQEIGRTITGK